MSPRRSTACAAAVLVFGCRRHQEREAREAQRPRRRSRRPRAPGRPSTAIDAPQRVGSSSIASEPRSPAMLTSLAATTTRRRPARRAGGRRRRAGAPLVERREEREVGPHRAVEAHDQRQPLPGRDVRRRQRAARAAAEAERRQRGAIGAVRSGARRRPARRRARPRSASRRSTARHVSGGPTTVSTMARGTAPMAATSLTLVSTAATPAPYGSCSTKAGRIASPHAITCLGADRHDRAVVTGSA